jgi:hypothetical protein
LVREKEDAVDFQFKEGHISFENLGFKHHVMDKKPIEVVDPEK